MTNLCGHDRDVLIWALTSTGRWPEFVAGLLEPSPGLPVYTQRVLREFLAPKREPTLRAIHDPAKLAEMLAEDGRRLGIVVLGFADTSSFPFISLRGDGIGVYVEMVHCPRQGNQRNRQLTMHQARTILFQWLQLPDGAREEAERRLRGET